VARTELPEEVIERLIRAGALDSLDRPRRELLWQLREVMGATRGRADGRTGRRTGASSIRTGAAAGRPMDLRLPPTPAPDLPALTERERLGGLVVTRQHPMTARGTVFLALEDETGMVNVTLWPDAWARLRGVVRRHAPLYVEGVLQREANVVNVVAREVRPLPAEAERAGGPARPEGVRALGYSGMRRG
jgi:DNA polymerase III alpha subunit